VSAVIFDIANSRDFLWKLEADFDEFMKEPGSGRLALNCALTAYHLHEWVWGDWLKAQKIFKNKDAFLAWIDTACPWFRAMQELANGTKHFGPGPSFKAEFVGSTQYIWGQPAVEWDEGAPRPYVADGGKGHLLLDFGAGTGEHRWKTAASLIDAVVRFWRQFFAQYHPDPEVRVAVRDWRLL
jgi:hypothetical protein